VERCLSAAVGRGRLGRKLFSNIVDRVVRALARFTGRLLPLPTHAIHPFRKAAVFEEAFSKTGQLAVEEGARHRNQYERRVRGDFFVPGFPAVMPETGADLSDPLGYLLRAPTARVDEPLPERLVVGPFL
jgi:hypothetical protein